MHKYTIITWCIRILLDRPALLQFYGLHGDAYLPKNQKIIYILLQYNNLKKKKTRANVWCINAILVRIRYIYVIAFPC